MSDEVLVERRGAVQVIIINRPEARNALNGAVAAAGLHLAGRARRSQGVRREARPGLDGALKCAGTFTSRSGRQLTSGTRRRSPVGIDN